MFALLHLDLVWRFMRPFSGTFRVSDWTLSRVDPDGLRYVAAVSVWIHWFVIAACCVLVFYRPPYGPPMYVANWLLYLVFVAFNAYVHYRLASGRIITWRWIFFHYALDVAVVSAAAAVGGGFSHYFMHLLYYPVLACFAVFFSSFRLNMAFVTFVAILYLAICLTVGDGIDLLVREEKPLFARIVVMYGVVAAVNLVSKFERARWRAAVGRERVLQQERIEFSQSIHDTTAQSAYMIGLGVDAARALAGDSNPELTARLEATSRLSKAAIWELRHPIDMGSIFDGRGLGRTLEFHVSTFTQVTAVPAELVQNGQEPSLPVETRRFLFTIAHNALTNAFRHAEAGGVVVGLDFRKDEVSLSVSDDGIGLPDDYAERGHGFANMRADAELLGGRLLVEARGPSGGAKVTCVMPLTRNREEGVG